MTSVGSAQAAETTSGLHWRSRAVEIGWCVALAVGPYLWRVQSGTRRLPNDDTWAYERIFETFYDTGRIVLIDWNDITLVGMLPVTRAWVELVGYGPLQVHLLGAVMGLVSLLALRSIMHRLQPDLTLLAILTMGTFTGFLTTTGTFMADQFALTGVMVAFALVVRVLTDPGRVPPSVLVVGAAVAAAYGFSVRQQAAIAAFAIFIVLAGTRRRLWWGWLVFALVYAALILPLYLWRAGLEDGGTIMVRFNSRFILVGWILLTVSVLLTFLPMVLARDRSRMSVPVPIRVVVSLVVGTAAGLTDFAGYVNDSLSVIQRIGDLPPVGQAVVAVVLANLALSVAAALARRRLPVGDDLGVALAVAAVFTLLGDVGVVLLSSEYLSRYSLFFVAIALAAVAASRPADAVSGANRRLAWLAIAVLGISAYWAMDGGLAPLRVAQDAAEIAACAGVPPERLDAGIVWMGMHSTGVVVADYWSRPWRDDGLPTGHHERIFPAAVRDAVVIPDVPDDMDDLPAVLLESGGMLPGNSTEAWLVVREDRAEELIQCARR